MLFAALKLLPVPIAFALAFRLFRRLAAQNRFDVDWRLSFAFANVLTGILFVAIAEIAGALHQLNAGMLLALWLLADGVLWAAFRRTKSNTPLAPVSVPPPPHRTLFIFAAAMLLVFGVVALAAPTTIWDSHTYHMARVMHWLQQQSLDHYPSNVLRQLEMAPGAEVQVATLVALAGHDGPANLPQWWALLVCAVAAASLTERLLQWPGRATPGDAAKAQWCGLFAAVLVVTSPPAVTQSITTQNDLVTAMWVILLTVFGWLLAESPKNIFYSSGVAATLALGLHAKPTMFLYAAPPGLALGIWLLWKSRRSFLILGFATTVFVVALNLPWMGRNLRTIHHPLGTKDLRTGETIQNPTIPQIAANTLRNLSLYTGTVSSNVTSSLNSALRQVNQLTAQPLEDPAGLWPGEKFFFCGGAETWRGDGLGSIITILPLTFAAGIGLTRRPRWSPLNFHLGLLAVGFILFCGYVRWQPWAARLHLPYLFLAAPFVGAVLGSMASRHVIIAASIFLMVNALLILLWNTAYPVHYAAFLEKGREEKYFRLRPEIYAGTAELAQDIVNSGATNVLLKIGDNTWEYPLWVCLQNRGFRGTIEHAFVENESASIHPANISAPGTVLVSKDARFSPPSDFGLAVFYDDWTARFRGNKESRLKLIDDRAGMAFLAAKPTRLEFHCRPIDAGGKPFTNGIIRLETGDFTNDFPLQAPESIFVCPVKEGMNSLKLTLMRTDSTERGTITLAHWSQTVVAR